MHQLHDSVAELAAPALHALPFLLVAGLVLGWWRRTRGVPAAAALTRTALDVLLAAWAVAAAAAIFVPTGDLAGSYLDLGPGDGVRPLLVGAADAGPVLAGLGANLLLFVPLGLLLPLRTEAVRAPGPMLFVACAAAFGLEIAQYVAGVGHASTTDEALCGVAGAFCGYVVAVVLLRALGRPARRAGIRLAGRAEDLACES